MTLTRNCYQISFDTFNFFNKFKIFNCAKVTLTYIDNDKSIMEANLL